MQCTLPFASGYPTTGKSQKGKINGCVIVSIVLYIPNQIRKSLHILSIKIQGKISYTQISDCVISSEPGAGFQIITADDGGG